MSGQLAAPAVSTGAMRALMRPRSVALIGASDDPTAIGGAPIANLRTFSMQRPLCLVSRSRPEIDGVKTLPSISALPDGIDCAILVVPSRSAAQALEECGERGVRAAIVFASGFAETGPDGAAAQTELADIARRYGMAVAGPNCLGLINFVDGLPLTFGAITPFPVPPRGGLGLIAQSGAMTMALTYAAHAERVPVTYAASTGNEAVVTLEDYLRFLLDDDSTRVVAILAEQVRRPREFRRLAARARQIGKPVVVLRAGRAGAAAAAAQSHTGALATDYAVIEAVLRSEGVTLVDTLDELVDVAGLLLRYPPPAAPGIGLVTDSGSVKTLSLDLAETMNASIAQLSQATVAQLTEELPEFASSGNPVDITAQALNKPLLYARAASRLLQDDAVGALVIAAMPGSDRQTAEQVDALLPVLAGAAKPVMYVFMGGGHLIPGGHDDRVRAAGIPVLRSVERALRCVAQATRAVGARPRDVPTAETSATPPCPEGPDGGTAIMTEQASKQLLRSYGLPIPEAVFARSVAELPALAGQLRYPLALKGQAPSLVHKTEAGAVVIGIQDETELCDAAAQMHSRLAGADHIEGYLLEQMAGPGIELILGARRDPDWDTVLLIGFGGVLTEVLDDVALLPGTAGEEAVRAGLDRLRGRALLDDFRGSGPADVDAVVQSVLALATFMREQPQVTEVDVNPLRVFTQGHGAMLLDATVITCNGAPARPAEPGGRNNAGQP